MLIINEDDISKSYEEFRAKVKKGKLPENKNECVIDTKMAEAGYKIGDEITLNNKHLREKKLKIKGIIQSPEYLAMERGNSTLLSGKINYYVYVLEENINSDVYSELYIKYDTPEKAFTEEYDDYIEKKEIETTYAISGYYKEKFNDLINQYQIEITTARAQYDAEKSKIDAKFIEAQNEIDNKKIRNTKAFREENALFRCIYFVFWLKRG